MAVAGPSKPKKIYNADTIKSVPLLTLSNTLLGASNDLPDWFEEAFEARQHLFTPDTFGGLTKITSKTVVPQNSIKWTDEERKLADEASSKLGLPSDEALVLIRSWKILQYGPAHWQDGDDDEADDLWWDRLQDFYFEERLTAIKFLSDVAELADNTESTLAIAKFCKKYSKTLLPAVTDILKSFQNATTRTWPDSAKYSASAVVRWTKQHLKEERDLLNLIFGLWYSKSSATGSDAKLLLECIKTCEWGNRQATTPQWDAECRALANVITSQLIVLTIEVFGLEELADDRKTMVLPLATQRLPEDDNLLHPAMLSTVNDLVLNLAASYTDLAAPLSFAWSNVLFRLSDCLEDGEEVHASYNAFLRVLKPEDDPNELLWQKLFMHSLNNMFGLLSSVVDILSSQFATPQILNILKSPIGLIPIVLKLGFLPEHLIEELTAYAIKVFGHTEAGSIRAQFWGIFAAGTTAVSAEVDGERQLLDLHARRFPLRPDGLLGMLRALSGSAPALDPESAERTCAYLASLPYLTCAVATRPGIVAQPFEISNSDPTLFTVVKPSGMQITAQVSIPANSEGRLVSSGASSNSVVQWDLTAQGWNAWLWIYGLLEQYAGSSKFRPASRKEGADPFVADDQQSSRLSPVDSGQSVAEQTIAHALDLWSKDLLSPTPFSFQQSDSSDALTQAAQIGFAILDRAISSGALDLTDAGLRFITALLPSSPGVIWSLLRSDKAALFALKASKGRRTLLSACKAAGSYKCLLSLIELVYALVLEAQRSQNIPSHFKTKASVLEDAFRYLDEAIWSEKISAWRFSEPLERWRLLTNLSMLWSSLVYDGSLPSDGTLGSASRMAIHRLVETRGVSILADHAHSAYQAVLSAVASGQDSEANAAERALASIYWLFLLLTVSYSPPRCASASFSSGVLLNLERNTLPGDFLVPSIIAFSASESETCALACQILAAIASTSDTNESSRFLGLFKDPPQQMEALQKLASDEQASDSLKSEVWNLMAALIANQPGVAIVLVAGKLSPMAIEEDLKEKQSKGSRFLGTAVEQLKRTDANTPPSLVSALLRTLIAVWSQVIDFSQQIEEANKDQGLWDTVVDIVTSPAEPLERLEDVRTHCENIVCQALGMRLFACMIEAEVSPPSEKPPIGQTALIKLLSSRPLMARTTLAAAHTDANATLHQSMQAAFATDLPAGAIALEHLRKSRPLNVLCMDVLCQYGSSYYYDLNLVFAKLSALVPADDGERLTQILEAVNCNWSLIDAQAILLDSWSQLLSQSFGMLNRHVKAEDGKAIADTAMHCLIETCELSADERQAGDIIWATHKQRLSLVKHLLLGSRLQAHYTKEVLLTCWKDMQRLIDHDVLNVFESIERHSDQVTFHLELAECIYDLLSISEPLQTTSLEAADQVVLSKVYEAVLRFSMAMIARRHSSELDQNSLALAVSLLLKIVRLPSAPRPSVWLGLLRERDFWEIARAAAIQAGSHSSTTSDTASQTNHFVCLQVFILLLGMSDLPAASEQTAVEGIVQAITNSPIAGLAEAGGIDCASNGQDSQLWCLVLPLVARLAVSLQASATFVDEVCGFAHLCLAQFRRAFSWQPSTSSLSVRKLTEMQASVTIFGIISRRAPTNAACKLLSEDASALINALVYAVQHPNTLASGMQPANSREEIWLKQGTETSNTSTAAIDSVDFNTRPVAGAIVQALLGCLCQLLDSLNASLCSLDVLRTDMYQWPFDKAVVGLSAKANPQEPATVGTLIELASYCVDVIRHQSSSTAPANPESAFLPPLIPWSPSICKSYASHLLEASLLLAVTQMALAWHQPGSGSTGNSRAQRIIRNEIQPDIQALIGKASGLEMRTGSTKSPQKQKNASPSRLLSVLNRFAGIYLQR